jgi:pyridoxamine 5'-phosphate oxidase family protein
MTPGQPASKRLREASLSDADLVHRGRCPVLIGGLAMGKTRKFRNVRRNPSVALVVDDLASTAPWVVRGIEVRGSAEALDGVDPPMRGMSREVIRITPHWIASWGVEPGESGMKART